MEYKHLLEQSIRSMQSQEKILESHQKTLEAVASVQSQMKDLMMVQGGNIDQIANVSQGINENLKTMATELTKSSQTLNEVQISQSLVETRLVKWIKNLAIGVVILFALLVIAIGGGWVLDNFFGYDVPFIK
jgi:hypothetical protein